LSTKPSDWLDLFSGEVDRDLVLPLLSGSMADALLPGDMLTVRALDGKNAHIGDIVVFRDDRKLVAHRLIFVFRLFSFALFMEKGDANPTATIIKPEMIVGRVEAARRNGILVMETTPEARRKGRRLASRALVRYIISETRAKLARIMSSRHA
jgi:signal peptidase I